MVDRTLQLRLRRLVRRRKRIVESASVQVEENIEKLFFRRLSRLASVRRFVFGWVLLVMLLITAVGLQARSLGQYYLKVAPVEGGTLREGVLGTFSTANPLYADNPVDNTVVKLVFSGLFTHDNDNRLVPDLAEKIESDERGQVYTVSLRQNISWHDGKPFTAADVVFTYQTIQNPDAKSALFQSWQGVTVEQVDDYAVRFTLPNPLVSFPYSLVNGIVPKHILESTPAAQQRSTTFNTQPVGTGPFKWQRVEVDGLDRESRSEQVALTAYDSYHFGRPKIDQYVLRTYKDETRMFEAFNRRELTAIVGMDRADTMFASDGTAVVHNIPMDGAVMLFLNNSRPGLDDVKVRRALVQGTDTQALLKSLGFPVIAVHGPLLKGQLGYDPALVQLPYDLAAAQTQLDEAGWLRDESDGIRKKDGQELRLSFVSQSIAEYSIISQGLQKMWQDLGVKLDVQLRPEEEIQSDVLTRHEYDVLLYGISIGQDSDVFPYWHSTQADLRASARLNLSEFKNKATDAALEAGRTRTDPEIRSVKYRPFLQAWRDEAPAIALYQPRFLYIARNELDGFRVRRLSSTVDRLNNIHQWTVQQDRVVK